MIDEWNRTLARQSDDEDDDTRRRLKLREHEERRNRKLDDELDRALEDSFPPVPIRFRSCSPPAPAEANAKDFAAAASRAISP